MLAPGESLDFAVTGQCMAPQLCDGQRISVRKQSWYFPGDIIAFADIHGNPMVHRFLGWIPGKRGLRSMSKADASRAMDVLFPRQNILGKVIAVDAVPYKVAMTKRVVAVCNYVRCSLGKLVGRPLSKAC